MKLNQKLTITFFTLLSSLFVLHSSLFAQYIVSTFTGSDSGFVNGFLAEAKFSCPRGIVLDNAESKIYVIDSKNFKVRVITTSPKD